MLYRVINKYDNGLVEDFIDYSEGGYGIDPKNIKISIVGIFKYEIESSIKPLIVELKGEKFITPGWVPCHPKTKLNDIIWIKKVYGEEKKPKDETHTWRFKSSSGDNEYVTKKKGLKYTCNCPGAWRAKDGECKHIKEVKSYNE